MLFSSWQRLWFLKIWRNKPSKLGHPRGIGATTGVPLCHASTDTGKVAWLQATPMTWELFFGGWFGCRLVFFGCLVVFLAGFPVVDMFMIFLRRNQQRTNAEKALLMVPSHFYDLGGSWELAGCEEMVFCCFVNCWFFFPLLTGWLMSNPTSIDSWFLEIYRLAILSLEGSKPTIHFLHFQQTTSKTIHELHRRWLTCSSLLCHFVVLILWLWTNTELPRRCHPSYRLNKRTDQVTIYPTITSAGQDPPLNKQHVNLIVWKSTATTWDMDIEHLG